MPYNALVFPIIGMRVPEQPYFTRNFGYSCKVFCGLTMRTGHDNSSEKRGVLLIRATRNSSTTSKSPGKHRSPNRTAGCSPSRCPRPSWVQSISRYKGKSGGSDVSSWLLIEALGIIHEQRTLSLTCDLLVRRAAVGVCGGIPREILHGALN